MHSIGLDDLSIDVWPSIPEKGIVSSPLLLSQGEVDLRRNYPLLFLIQRGDLPSDGVHDLAVTKEAQCPAVVPDSVGSNQMKRVVKGPRLCNEIPVVRIGIFPVGADDQQVHTL